MEEIDQSREGWKGPAVVAIAFIAMLMWSWGTWPDPLVDFGTQLYVPWQLLQGKCLYRDIAYYNGPLSQYVNAGWFALQGVGLRSIVGGNLLILCATAVLVYRLMRRASGELAATAGGVVFAVVFAFGQGVGIGNFNWVTPYTNEITHGVALGLLGIACADRYGRSGSLRWLAAGGWLLGLTFLTKAEPFAAAGVAIIVQLISMLWMGRAEGGKWGRDFGVLLLCALAMPVVAFGLLSMAMPWKVAAAGVAGSWRWAFDRRITSLPFYRHVQGLDDVAANLGTILRWLCGYAIILVPALLIALRTVARRCRIVAAAVFAIVGAILGTAFFHVDWNWMIAPLPVCLLAALISTAAPVVRRSWFAERAALRLSLVVYSIVLLAKIGLSPHVYHYGFALALPGTLVLVATVAEEVPAWIERRGGCGNIFRTAGLAMGLAGMAATLYVDAGFFRTKRWWVGSGADVFHGSTRALEVETMAQLIDRTVPGDETVAVFPQGLMLNYLTRRSAPTRYINFMPPEVIAAGENEVLAALKERAPGAIVLNFSTLSGDQFDLDNEYFYGRSTLDWIRDNYQVVAVAELPPSMPTFFHLMLLRPKNAVRVALPTD